jgi:hypothetical protein
LIWLLAVFGNQAGKKAWKAGLVRQVARLRFQADSPTGQGCKGSRCSPSPPAVVGWKLKTSYSTQSLE